MLDRSGKRSYYCLASNLGEEVFKISPLTDDETWTTWWLVMSELEMPDMAWFNVEKKIQRLKRFEC